MSNDGQRGAATRALLAALVGALLPACSSDVPAACTDLADAVATPAIGIVDRTGLVDQLEDEALRNEVRDRWDRSVDDLLAEAGEHGVAFTPQDNAEAAELAARIAAASDAGCTLADLAPTLATRFERASAVPFLGHPDRLVRLAEALRPE